MDYEKLASEYRTIPVAVLHDVLVKAGAPHQVMSCEIKSADGLAPFAGPAFCVRGERVMGGPSTRKDRRFEIYRQIPKGSVLVIASGGQHPGAVLGENMVASLRVRGCVGIVTDGGYRDQAAISAMNIPVRAAFVTPISSVGQYNIAELDVTVALPGQSCSTVFISSGDLVVGDFDGTIVVPRRGLLTILEDCHELMEAEGRTRQLIMGGEDAEVAYKANDRFGHIRQI